VKPPWILQILYGGLQGAFVGSICCPVSSRQKRLGQFFTPPEVAQTLVNWVAPGPNDRLLDPACGDGTFLVCHRRSVGVEVDPQRAALARLRAPDAVVHLGDFFSWAEGTDERFDVAAGNPPFIRYQQFAGEVRERALAAAARMGAQFNGLSSSWAPFLVVAARLLRLGGAMAFVVPAEVGHATCAVPLVECLCRHFELVRFVACREKLFPELSEDAWLLYCAGFGGSTRFIGLSACDSFAPSPTPPLAHHQVSLASWREASGRLRRFLLPKRYLDLYEELMGRPGVCRLSEIARAGVGYVTGDNDFFHLRPSEARLWSLPDEVLRVAVRRAEQLPPRDVDESAVRQWLADDQRVLLLDLKDKGPPAATVRRYLSTPEAERARRSYKCRNREPWYAVPDVKAPDAFMSYMSGRAPSLVANSARCVCTNSVHAVVLKAGVSLPEVQAAWRHPLCQLSCELEGHPLGGGMLKLEPGEAARTRLPLRDLELTEEQSQKLDQAIQFMRRWRHYD